MVEGLELYRPVYRGNQDVGSLGQKQRFVIEEFLKTWKKKRSSIKRKKIRCKHKLFPKEITEPSYRVFGVFYQLLLSLVADILSNRLEF